LACFACCRRGTNRTVGLLVPGWQIRFNAYELDADSPERLFYGDGSGTLFQGFFFAEPDAINTLARRNWYARYLPQRAKNSLGYRDQEWSDELVADKTKVMVVGDSFVEGLGIENPDDRFSGLLAQQLGSNYVVFNLGDSGSNTGNQIEALLQYPYSPDILIWSYFVNDIEGKAGLKWLEKPPLDQLPPPWSPFENSHALNFLYWRIYRLSRANEPDAYWAWLLSIYNDPEAWWLYRQQLLSIYEGAKSEQVPLIVVVFPGMQDAAKTTVVTDRVVDLFESQGVATVEVFELVEHIPCEQLMASPVDPHPSELVNRLVADALYEIMMKKGLVQ